MARAAEWAERMGGEDGRKRRWAGKGPVAAAATRMAVRSCRVVHTLRFSGGGCTMDAPEEGITTKATGRARHWTRPSGGLRGSVYIWGEPKGLATGD